MASLKPAALALDFERYRLPASVRDGVEIELPGTSGARFLVRLPSRYNREYTAASQRSMRMTLDENGQPDFSGVDFVAFKEARLAAFLDHCIVAYPDGLDRDMLAGDYRPGLEALFERAEEIANEEEAEAIESTKK